MTPSKLLELGFRAPQDVLLVDLNLVFLVPAEGPVNACFGAAPVPAFAICGGSIRHLLAPNVPHHEFAFQTTAPIFAAALILVEQPLFRLGRPS